MSLRFDPILKEKDKVEREKELSLLGSGLKLGDPPLPPEGKPLFRGDGRPPSLMFSGITARGTNTDLYSHVFPPGKYTNSYSSQESAYISTSKSKEMATTFPKELRPGTQETYVYEIHVKQPVIDVASELMSNPKITRDPLALDLLRYEKEMAVPFRIKSNEIKGGWRVDVTRELLTPEELRLLHSKESVQSSVKNNPRVMQDEFIPNPRYPAHIISKFWAVAKGAGKVITGIGLYIDAASLNTEYQTSRESGDYNNTHTEAARIVGGWSGAYTAGTAGVKLGVAACAPFGIYASAACGFVSGLVSSFVGYQAGGKFSTYIFDESKKCFAKFDIKTESVDPKLQTLANHKLLLTPKKSMKELNMFGSQTSEQERKQQQISEEYHQRLQASEEKSAAHFREEILSRTVSDNKSSIPITTSMSVTSSSSHQVTKISTKRGQSHAPSTTPIVNEDKSVRPIPSQEDKQIADFLITWGAKPADVVKLYQKAPDWEMAKRAVAKFNELELKMEQQRNQQRCLEFFNGASVVCTALSQSNNRELARVGTIALPVLSLMANSERLWGIFSGGAGSLAIKGFWASSGAIGGLIAAGIGLLNVFMRGEASQQRALMRGLQEIHQQIIAFRHEVHERFDRVESALRGIAGAMQSYCNQILRNQQTLFEQQKKHIELSLRGFSVVTSMLSDMRMENQQFHARIFRELSYLVGLHEIASLQSLKESIESKVILIKDNSEMPATPERIQSMSDTLSGLKGELKRCVSSDYNGQKEFILSSGEPLQSLNSLMKRSLRSDDALGFLAEVFERMTETSLADSKIDKNQLPVTALWPNAVMQFITLSRLPQFSHFPVQSTLADIQSQYENIIRFTQHIRESKIILNLLDRHQEYLENFQLTLNHYFIDRQKKLTLTSKDEEKVSEKRMTIDDYFTEGADRSLLYKIDYNYILLTRFAELAGLSPAIQQHIAQIDKRTDLLEQAFDFNEMPKSFQASSLCDASMTAVYNYVYKYSYQREFLEHVGGHLYGAPGSEKMIFITSYMYSQDQPGAQDASTLGANEYDITTCRYTMGCNMRSHSMPAHNTERFPLSQYKKCFNTSVDHAWASTHLVTYNNNPFLIFHTGGAAYAAVYSINEAKPEEKWYHVDNSKKPPSFSVPLLFSNQNGTKPDTTCYTHIIRNKYMLETRLKWQKLSPPTIEYYAYDIIAGKWHNEPLELFSTDSRQILSELKIEDKNLNPNHFFINMVPDYGVYHKSSSLFYGIFQGGNQLRLNVYHNDIQNYFFRLRNHQPYSYTYNSTHTFPLEIKIIHQTHSELMKIDGVNRLMIPLTVTTSNDEMKLAIISFDYNNAQYVFQHFSLPPIHTNSDWQAMRTTVAKISGREQLIITLLNPEYQMLIFSYDPKLKSLQRLTDGPQLKFVDFQTNGHKISFSMWDVDQYLLRTRANSPGFYPVRPIEIRFAELKKMSTLLVSYPTVSSPCSSTYEIRVMHIPLGPVLKLKSTATVKALLPAPIVPALPLVASSGTAPLLTTSSSTSSSTSALISTSLSSSPSSSSASLESTSSSSESLTFTESSPPSSSPLEIPANHLTAELLQIQLLLSLPNPHVSSAQEIKHEEKENKMLFHSDLPVTCFELAYDICCDARDLFAIVIPDLKIVPEHSSILKPKIERLNAILSASTQETFSIDKLRNVFNIINTIDGILKYHQNYSVAANIQEMLAQLKTEIKKYERIKPSSPLIEKSLFSIKSAETLPFGLLSNEQKTNDIRNGR